MQSITKPLQKVIAYIREALGPPGVPADLAKVLYVAQSAGRIYEAALGWSLRTRYAIMDEIFDEAKESLSLYAFSIIDGFESFSNQLRDDLAKAIALHKLGQKASVNINWVLTSDQKLIDKSVILYKKALLVHYKTKHES